MPRARIHHTPRLYLVTATFRAFHKFGEHTVQEFRVSALSGARAIRAIREQAKRIRTHPGDSPLWYSAHLIKPARVPTLEKTPLPVPDILT